MTETVRVSWRRRPVVALALGLGSCGPAHAAGWDWPACAPETKGMSAAQLEALRVSLAQRGTKALLVIRDDAVVLEWYAPGHSAAQPHYTASMAKALVAGLSAAVALDDGRIALDDHASKWIPSWADDPLKARITLRQLGSHTSGLDDAEEGGLPHDRLTGWQGAFWKRLAPPDDPFTISRDRVPVRSEPGRELHYSNPGIADLTYAVTAALKGTRAEDVRSLLRDRIMRPIGVPDHAWSVGYGATVRVDGLPLVGSWGGASYTARAVAAVGRLLLREGDWHGTRLLRAESVRAVTNDAGTPGSGGIGWWSNNERECAELPRDAYWGSGAGHQVLLVVPSLKLIAVRNGGLLEKVGTGPRAFHEPLCRVLFAPLVAAVTAAPYPPSTYRLEWAPRDEIVRAARGSDNWPITWADNGRLYTAYGDGHGFGPAATPKLSLGLARVEGGPRDFRGENLPAPMLEATGDDRAGRKASGLLMVDGVLYLWARNAGNAQLAWSRDHGATWSWADWRLAPSFGYPTFLNFGSDYTGARDAFVYVYSHDADSAYTPADRMVLARVSRTRLRDRGAYEFYAGLGPDRQPRWTSEIDDRAAVFEHAGKCYRSGITYNPGLRRYLWCQTLPGGDARFRGGFGVYDAPEPWGPWTTVFYTEEWDVGPGETSCFPTKWMSADGRSLALLFSGDDCFSVRSARVAGEGR